MTDRPFHPSSPFEPTSLLHNPRVVFAPPPDRAGLVPWRIAFGVGAGEEIEVPCPTGSAPPPEDDRGAGTAIAADSVRRWSLPVREGSLELGAGTRLLGVVNVTPDSFSDGGRYHRADAAVEHAIALVEEGCDALDVGGESTRPGADPVPADEEMHRVLPVVEHLARAVPVPISIDTTKAGVARAALEAGASIVNDISGGRLDPGMGPLLAERGVPVVVGHLRGTPRTMQDHASYRDPVAEVLGELRLACAELLKVGVDPRRIVVDPGLGFGKRPQDNLEILRRLAEFRSLGRPVLVGPSRKSFLGAILGGREPSGRAWATAAAVALSVSGGAAFVRVHDVGAMRDVVRTAEAIREGRIAPWAE